MSGVPPALRAALERAQRHGVLGPGPVDRAIDHATGFLEPGGVSLPGDLPTTARCIDLGSGAGVPGLPLALAHPETRWLLVDGWARRVDLLRDAIRALDLEARVTAVHARAEELGRADERGSADLVTARSFGPPARTAECAAPLLTHGGWFVVSTSPSGAEWPAALPALGLGPVRRWRTDQGSYAAYRRFGDVPERFPRRPAAQARAPLF